jgi:hypothetical protein
MKILEMGKSAAILAVLPVIYLAFLSCTDSGKKIDETASKSYVSAHLLNEPSPDYDEINLHIAELKLSAKDGKVWVPLFKPNAGPGPHPLSGKAEPLELTARTPLPKQEYQLCSLVLDGKSTVTPKGGSKQPLRLPEALRAGIPLPFPAGSEGKDYDLVIVFDPVRSIQRSRDASGGFQYTLRHALRLVDRNTSGRIEGRVTDAAGAPREGIAVTAQTRTITDAIVIRSARTAADGKYLLDLLSLPHDPYHVVSLPGPQTGGQHHWQALASQGFPLTSKDPNRSFNAQLQPATDVGSVSGTIRGTVDAATTHDEVELLQALPAGVGYPTHLFLVRVALAEPNPNSAESTFSLAGLPVGSYMIRQTRCHLDASGKLSRTPLDARPVVVRANETTVMDF